MNPPQTLPLYARRWFRVTLALFVATFGAWVIARSAIWPCIAWIAHGRNVQTSNPMEPIRLSMQVWLFLVGTLGFGVMTLLRSGLTRHFRFGGLLAIAAAGFAVAALARIWLTPPTSGYLIPMQQSANLWPPLHYSVAAACLLWIVGASFIVAVAYYFVGRTARWAKGRPFVEASTDATKTRGVDVAAR